MMGIRISTSVAVVATLCSLAAGCAKDRRPDKEVSYGLLAAQAVRLYMDLHPLRSSRLGLSGADSLLFTFGDEEIRETATRLAELEDRLSSLPAARLSNREIDEALVMIHWARSERFALERLETHRGNPLLYVWMAENALWEMPARITDPRPDEGEDYRKRLLGLPKLFANAALQLRSPPGANARQAAERSGRLAAEMDELGRLAAERYGVSFERELSEARIALLDFARFLSPLAEPGTRGHVILGAENLSKIFLYEELLNIDPNMLLAEAERRITRLAADRTAVGRRVAHEREIHPPGVAPGGKSAPAVEAGDREARPSVPKALAAEPAAAYAARVIDTLWTSSVSGAPFGLRRGAKPALRHPVRTRYRSRVPRNPYLSLPSFEEPLVVAAAPPFAGPACQPLVLLSEQAARAGAEELRSELLEAAPALLEADRILCETVDTVAVVFASETWREGLIHLSRLAVADELRTHDLELYARFIDGEIRRLARAIIVLRLHAGALTTEGAASYLVETALISREEAAREVFDASVSPAIAWPGISLILVERMIDRIAEPGGSTKPREETRKNLIQSRGLPLVLIEQKLR